MKGKIAALVIVIIFLGFGFYGYQLYVTANEIEVTNISLSSLEVKGWPIPTKILLEIDLYVKNPTSYSVDIERLTYDIYINGKFAAEGTRGYFLISPNSQKPIGIPLEITTSDILRLIGSLITEGNRDIEVDIKGMIDIPIKFFGVIKTITISVPFEQTFIYTIPVPKIQLPWEKAPPTGTETTRLVLDPPPDTVSEGSTIIFTGRLYGPVEGTIFLGNVIKIYDSDWPSGDDLMASGETDYYCRFSISWVAKRMDPLDRTVEVYAKFVGVQQYQPSESKIYTITIR